MKYHCVKCCIVKAAKKLKIIDVTNDIRVNLSPSIVWFEDELCESWWACNTPTNHTRKKKKIQRLCKYETVQLMMT